MNAKHFQKLILIVGTVLATSMAHADDLIAYEPFDYGSTSNLQFADGGFGWSSEWGKLSSIPTGVASPGLTWPELVTKGSTAITAAYQSTDFTRYSRVLADYKALDDILYFSFLMSANFGYGVTAGLEFGPWENGIVVGMCPTGMYGLMTPPYTDHSDSTVALVQGETALLVARVDRNDDSTTTWSLFVNPTVGDAEPKPDATLTVPISTLPQTAFILNDGGFMTDEIRFGHTWNSVLPKIGDSTGNGIVDVDDVLDVINAWGKCPNPCPPDHTDDAVVDVDDLLVVINNWG